MKPILTLLAVPALALPAMAHGVTANGYSQLKINSTYFTHAKSSDTAKIGAPLPNFAVSTLSGAGLSKSSFKGKMGLLVLADTLCPCVDAVEDRITNLYKRYSSKGLRVAYVFATPDQKPPEIARFMKRHQVGFPAIMDKDQRLLRMLDGRCSSEVYLFDKKGVLRYHGRVDNQTFGPKKATQHNLADAVAALTNGKPVPRAEAPAMGCTIPRLGASN